MISAIVAVSTNGVIGKKGELPWYLPSELARFKQITMGHPIIMGRHTHESIGRALPGRTNIVITHNTTYTAEGCNICSSLEDALKVGKESEGSDEIFIIGGESVYKDAMPKIQKLYLTKVNAKIDGDKFFEYEPKEWRELSAEPHKADDKNKYAYTFTILERK